MCDARQNVEIIHRKTSEKNINNIYRGMSNKIST